MSTATTLLDDVLPEFDFRSRHQRHVAAPPERVAETAEAFRPLGAAALLLRMRGLHVPSGSLRDALTGSGFTILAERPGIELVAGMYGKFWAPRERGHVEGPVDLRSFRAFDRPGWAQGAISLRIDGLEDGSTLLSTETRVRCVDETARRRFALYWSLINVFSGWLRKDMLRRIAGIAENAESRR
jgi:hypothetical protein